MYVQIYVQILFIHSPTGGHLGCSYVLAIINSSAINVKVHVSFGSMVFSGYMPRSGIAGSYGTSLVAQTVKRLPTKWEIRVQSLGQEDPLEREMATHSSILAWKIPWTEELGRIQSVCGVTKSRTRLSDFTFTFTW